MSTPQPNYLITEDSDLLFAIAELMKAHVPDWGTTRRDWKVEIKKARGVDDALNHETLSEYMKAGGLKILGVVVDADDKPRERWASIQGFCRKCNVQAPDRCPPKGFILDGLVGESGVEARFGAWLMPDNQTDGMIENFCFGLIPGGNEQLIEYTGSAVDMAKSKGAPFHPHQIAKARLHTWLAWQDPPGQSIGKAIASRTLRPDADSAKAFVAWFRELYGV